MFILPLSRIKVLPDASRTSACAHSLRENIDKHEIDFIVENQDGDLAGIEVKAGSGIKKDDFKHLAWFWNNLAQGRKFIVIVVHTVKQALTSGNGMLAVPLSAFWS